MVSSIVQGNVWNLTILGVDIYHILSWFFIFSFFGWIWETALVSIRSHKFVNRGFVTGPVCTIYGAGAVSVYLILRPLGEQYILIFLVGMVVATILEYVTSAVMETLFHAKWWDYSQHRFNVKGRICLGISIGWGFMSLALFLIFMPAARWIMSLYPIAVGQIGICVCIILYMVDFSLASVAAFNLEAKLQDMQKSLEELGQKLTTSKAFEFLEDTLEGLEERREHYEGMSLSQLAQRFEEARKEQFSRQDRISKRLLNSYPLLTKEIGERREEFMQSFNEKREEFLENLAQRKEELSRNFTEKKEEFSQNLMEKLDELEKKKEETQKGKEDK